MLIYKKSPQNIIVKGQKKYYYTGRAKIDTRIVEDTTFLAETIESYYNLKGNVVFSESQEFIRGMGSDDPCWGCSTAFLQNDTFKIYKRFIYNSINQLVLKIECSYFNSARKTTYEYDNAGNIISQKEIETSCDKFWYN